MAGKRGRPPRLTKDVHEAIIRALRVGAYRCHAAQAAGVDSSTLEKWLALGRAGDRRYAQLAADVDREQAADAIRLVSIVTRAALGQVPGDYRAACWALERKFPRLFGRAATMEAAASVTIDAVRGEDDTTKAPPALVTFYLPSNGRRPNEVDPEPGDDGASS